MPVKPASSKVDADIAKNRLTFCFSGTITRKQLDALYTDVRFCVADLKPGFHVISDLSECTLASLNCIPTFRKIMNFLIENKVGEVLRVTRHQSLIHRQLLNFSARMQGYKPIYVSSIEEAEEFLENSDLENRTRISLNALIANYSFGDSEGKGTLLELSTDCCAIENGSLIPAIDDKITLNFELHYKPESLEKFEIKATVTKVCDELFNCEFEEIHDHRKKQLWKCLVFEARREV